MLCTHVLNGKKYAFSGFFDLGDDEPIQELAEKKLSSYAASVFQTMTDKTGLTEGFMPIPAKKGRKSKEILKFVK